MSDRPHFQVIVYCSFNQCASVTKIVTSNKVNTEHSFRALYVMFKTRRFTKRNWVAFMIVNISELKKGNGELYMAHGNLNITMVYLRYT